MILNPEEREDSKSNDHSIEEQQVETGPASEQANDSIPTTLKEVISEEVRLQVANAMAAIPNILEEAVEQFFCVANP